MPRHTRSLALLTTLFFTWGFLTVMNDILIPYLKGVFELSIFRAMLVQFAFFGAYFIGSLLYLAVSVGRGDPIRRIGYRNGIVAGLLVSAGGALMFWPAAVLLSYGLFLGALFVLGLGFTLLQISANPYVTVLGSEEGASARLNLAQGFNSLGTTIAPWIGGWLIFRYFEGFDAPGADSVRLPYVAFAAALVLLAVLIGASPLPRIGEVERPERGLHALRYPHLALGIVAIFMYVGAEVAIGSILINYLALDEIAGLRESEASIYVSFYWGGLMVGRFLGSISLARLPPGRKLALMLAVPLVALAVVLATRGGRTAGIYAGLLALQLAGFALGRSRPARTTMIFAMIAVGLLVITMLTEGPAAMWSVIGVGLFNSIMWSNIFSLAIEGLGRHKSQASSLLVMAIIGGALFPPLQGAVADSAGIQASFTVPLLGYLYIVFYGWRGHRAGRGPVDTDLGPAS